MDFGQNPLMKNCPIQAYLPVFIERIEDVTTEIMDGGKTEMTAALKQSVIDINMKNTETDTKWTSFHELKSSRFCRKSIPGFLWFDTTMYDWWVPSWIHRKIWGWYRQLGLAPSYRRFFTFRIYAGPNNEPSGLFWKQQTLYTKTFSSCFNGCVWKKAILPWFWVSWTYGWIPAFHSC